MFNIKKTKVKVEVVDYTITLFIKDKKKSEVLYLDYGDYLSMSFFVKKEGEGHALVMKCKDENIERSIYVFDKKVDAEEALTKIADAMMERKQGFICRLSRLFKCAFKIALLALVVLLAYYMVSTSGNIEVPVAGKEKGVLKQEDLPQGKSVPLDEILK